MPKKSCVNLDFSNAEYEKMDRDTVTEKEKMGVMKLISEERKNFWKSPEFVEFNRQVRNKGLERARSGEGLGNVDKVDSDIREYFDLCEEYAQIPSIKGLCVYLGITYALYNEYMNDIDSEYCNLFRSAIDYIHTVVENGAMNNKINPATYMFTAANFYGMDNSKSVKIDTQVTYHPAVRVSSESIKALREELLRERADTVVAGPTSDANYVEK